MNRSIALLGTLFLSMTLGIGCAVAPPPTARVASSAAAIRAAQELRAGDTPEAQLRLQYAKDQYAEAQSLIAVGENEKADRLLQRAEADAELAVAIAKQVRSEGAAMASMNELQKVNSK